MWSEQIKQLDFQVGCGGLWKRKGRSSLYLTLFPLEYDDVSSTPPDRVMDNKWYWDAFIKRVSFSCSPFFIHFSFLFISFSDAVLGIHTKLSITMHQAIWRKDNKCQWWKRESEWSWKERKVIERKKRLCRRRHFWVYSYKLAFILILSPPFMYFWCGILSDVCPTGGDYAPFKDMPSLS